jgi:cytochrome c oxidase assembly protein subunit 15
LWVAFGLDGRARAAGGARESAALKMLAGLFAGLVFLQIILGGFVAGTDAGLSHNTWPLMDGAIIPDGLGVMRPWYVNLFENVLTIQFNHRMLGYGLAALAGLGLIAGWGRAGPRVRTLLALTFAGVLVQIALGVLALLSQLQIGLALAHQAGAILLFTLALYLLRTMIR